MCDGRACRPFLFLLRSIGLAEHRLRHWHRGSTRNTGSIRAYVPLPGGEVFSPSPDTFWHKDWLGSVRLASVNNRTITFDRAFAPFGEMYDTVAGSTSNADFTGDTQDTAVLALCRSSRPLFQSDCIR